MSYKNFLIERISKDRKFPVRDLRKDEIDKLKQKEKEFLDELLEEEADILAKFIHKYENYKNKKGGKKMNKRVIDILHDSNLSNSEKWEKVIEMFKNQEHINVPLVEFLGKRFEVPED